jgi:anionic cell wall polymer biosynthesis LytR-Cps2A-Psr (LCP) family protein
VDFGGFQAITDALGGVTVCVKELPSSLRARGFDNLNDRMSGWSGQVGENRLDGAQALAFVRQRYGLPEGDLDRIRRQQQFLSVVFHAMTAPSTLANPMRVRDVLDATTAALTVDQGTSLTDLEPLALRLRTLTGGGSGFETVPATAATRAGQSVLLVDPAKLAAFLAPLRPAPTSEGAMTSSTTGSVSADSATGVSTAGRTGSASLAVRPAALAAGATAVAATAQPSEASSCTY